ncbi:MAG: glycosyltransferase family 2 protein [Taibaiella sp.]|nr:glycosyltransferase family 2 protein [Taibaiella sp.]
MKKHSLDQSGSDTIAFSVVIPAYNAEQTIARALRSCINQSYSPAEIIVVDDAGTDNTGALIKASFPSVNYIKRLNNGGSGAARNTGINAARSNFIAFLDADDIWHPEKLLMAKNILDSQPGIHFLYHSYTLKDIYSIVLPERITLYKLPFIRLLYKNVIATPTAIIRKADNYRFNDTMRYMEDYDLWLRIAYRHKVYFVDTTLTQLGRPVLSKGGVSSNKWKMRRGELRAYSHLVRLNLLFVFLLPFLYTFSILKHLYKAIFHR